MSIDNAFVSDRDVVEQIKLAGWWGDRTGACTLNSTLQLRHPPAPRFEDLILGELC